MLPIAPEAEHPCRELLAPGTEPGLDVGRRDLERPPVGVSPAHEQVHVRVAGVVVVDRCPLERGAEIALHLGDQRPRVRGQIQPRSVLGGDDELPETHVARLLPSSKRGGQVHVVAFGVEAATLGAFTLGALAGEVRSVRSPGGAPAVARIGGLHGAPLKPPAGPRAPGRDGR